MNILYFTWFENSCADMISAFYELGHTLQLIHIPFQDYNQDEAFCRELERELHQRNFDFIFSFNFFPLVSHVASKNDCPYISWIYDYPHFTLYSKEIFHPQNHIFVFDHNQFLQLQKSGVLHVYHLPLAVNARRLNQMLGSIHTGMNYDMQLSFVGSLYENCQYNRIKYFPDYLSGYLNGLIQVQQRLYGYNIVSELLTKDIVGQLKAFISLEIPEAYDLQEETIFSGIVNAKVTSQERIHLLQMLSDRFPVALFTNSDSSLVPNAEYKGYVSYEDTMPFIFRHSKINLNFTLRSITSGIPLRAVDILGAGGFLLSNYQPELAQNFIDGEDLVLFDSEEDLLTKADYFLSHDKERMEIAENGWRKVQSSFSYEIKTSELLKTVFP